MTNKPILIGLNGLPKSGKDTLCDLLGAGAKRFAFGDALKRRCAEITGLPLEFFHDQSKKDVDLQRAAIWQCENRKGHTKNLSDFLWGESLTAPRSPRWWMRKVGMHERSKNPNVWLDATLGSIEAHMASADSVGTEFIVVTDMRMKNEMAFIQGNGGIPLRVVRDWREPSVDDVEKHISDTDLDEMQMDTITNHAGSPAQMLEQLKEVLRVRHITL